MERKTEELTHELRALVAKMLAYGHAQGVLYYDAATVAPPGSAEGRGKTLAVLSEVSYDLRTGEETGKLLAALMERLEKLDPVTRREVSELWREYERVKKIPKEEYIEYNVLLNEADAVWHKAKVESDWPAFEPYMEKIVAFNKKLAGWLDPEKKPYDALLDQYERGLTMETLDAFFAELREHLVPLIRQVAATKQPLPTAIPSTTYASPPITTWTIPCPACSAWCMKGAMPSMSCTPGTSWRIPRSPAGPP